MHLGELFQVPDGILIKEPSVIAVKQWRQRSLPSGKCSITRDPHNIAVRKQEQTIFPFSQGETEVQRDWFF